MRIMLALEAEIEARGPRGSRRIKAADFFTELLTTALEPDEVLTEVRIPALPAGSSRGLRNAHRRCSLS